jgi:putative addiction module component (TIGR02574 family)
LHRLNPPDATDTLCGMSKFTAADILELPVPERLQLVEDIWNTIADAPEALDLTDDDKRLIDERLEACRQNPGAGSPWEEVMARITARKK